jgi:hypothetical protein
VFRCYVSRVGCAVHKAATPVAAILIFGLYTSLKHVIHVAKPFAGIESYGVVLITYDSECVTPTLIAALRFFPFRPFRTLIRIFIRLAVAALVISHGALTLEFAHV